MACNSSGLHAIFIIANLDFFVRIYLNPKFYQAKEYPYLCPEIKPWTHEFE